MNDLKKLFSYHKANLLSFQHPSEPEDYRVHFDSVCFEAENRNLWVMSQLVKWIRYQIHMVEVTFCVQNFLEVWR